MNWFKKLMYGRYGGDQLSIVLLVLSVILSIISSLIALNYLRFLSYIPLVICIYRMMSKNIYKRQQENNKFLRFWNPLKKKVKQKSTQIKDKNHKYYKCSNCNTILRVPKGKGKISITCPKCKKKLIKKT